MWKTDVCDQMGFDVTFSRRIIWTYQPRTATNHVEWRRHMKPANLISSAAHAASQSKGVFVLFHVQTHAIVKCRCYWQGREYVVPPTQRAQPSLFPWLLVTDGYGITRIRTPGQKLFLLCHTGADWHELWVCYQNDIVMLFWWQPFVTWLFLLRYNSDAVSMSHILPVILISIVWTYSLESTIVWETLTTVSTHATTRTLQHTWKQDTSSPSSIFLSRSSESVWIICPLDKSKYLPKENRTRILMCGAVFVITKIKDKGTREEVSHCVV